MTDVVILGLGYVGLPLANEATRAGASVLGFDIRSTVVDALNAGRSHVDDLSDTDIAEMLAGGFRATTDENEIRRPGPRSSACPPRSPPTAARTWARSSRPPGRSRNLRPGCWSCWSRPPTRAPPTRWSGRSSRSSGLHAGVDFNLAFSPERIDPGNKQFGPRNTPKVVGGDTPGCTERAAAFYGGFVDTIVRTKGTREAETAKLLENTYRHVNIALVNEMARFCHELGIDLWDVIHAATTKPFGFQAFYPGPGVGGHCIPIDPNYLSHNVRAKLGYPFRFVELAQEINATMPAYVVGRAQNILNDAGLAVNGSRMLMLGVTYKPDIADQRESPAIPLARLLNALGAKILYHDPQVTNWRIPGVEVPRVDDLGSPRARPTW